MGTETPTDYNDGMANTWKRGWDGLGSNHRGIRISKEFSHIRGVRVEIFVKELSNFITTELPPVEAVRYLYGGGSPRNISVVWDDGKISYAKVWFRPQGDYRLEDGHWAHSERSLIRISTLGGSALIEQGVDPEDDLDHWTQVSSLGYRVTGWDGRNLKINSAQGQHHLRPTK
jgi:hypothetical protein